VPMPVFTRTVRTVPRLGDIGRILEVEAQRRQQSSRWSMPRFTSFQGGDHHACSFPSHKFTGDVFASRHLLEMPLHLCSHAEREGVVIVLLGEGQTATGISASTRILLASADLTRTHHWRHRGGEVICESFADVQIYLYILCESRYCFVVDKGSETGQTPGYVICDKEAMFDTY